LTGRFRVQNRLEAQTRRNGQFRNTLPLHSVIRGDQYVSFEAALLVEYMLHVCPHDFVNPIQTNMASKRMIVAPDKDHFG
jgi:hypothetical protein